MAHPAYNYEVDWEGVNQPGFQLLVSLPVIMQYKIGYFSSKKTLIRLQQLSFYEGGGGGLMQPSRNQ